MFQAAPAVHPSLSASRQRNVFETRLPAVSLEQRRTAGGESPQCRTAGVDTSCTRSLERSPNRERGTRAGGGFSAQRACTRPYAWRLHPAAYLAR